jgi:hypothetical protein
MKLLAKNKQSFIRIYEGARRQIDRTTELNTKKSKLRSYVKEKLFLCLIN